MSIATPQQPFRVADLLDSLGGIPADRVRMRPLPGTATEADVLAAENEPQKSLCELIDGTLVEKPMGLDESSMAMRIGQLLLNFMDEHGIGGLVAGEGGFLRLAPGSVRIPDVSYISQERLGDAPLTPIGNFAPDLAVEVISKSNTKREMEIKRQQYFAAGTRLVWEVQPKTKTVDVYTGPEEKTTLAENDQVTGGDVLPGLKIAVSAIFGKRP